MLEWYRPFLPSRKERRLAAFGSHGLGHIQSPERADRPEYALGQGLGTAQAGEIRMALCRRDDAAIQIACLKSQRVP